MLFRIFAAWLKWRKNWDSLCYRCGRCCYMRTVRPDGRVIIHYKDPCENLDTKKRVCKIYEERLVKCSHCKKVDLFTALFDPSLPRTCAYGKTFRLWKKRRD
ncbi:MAG: hypothetical protein LUC92_03665 [Clostridiales bacterium]|nr:hypothetical protein [Clostridiales bacterium]